MIQLRETLTLTHADLQVEKCELHGALGCTRRSDMGALAFFLSRLICVTDEMQQLRGRFVCKINSYKKESISVVGGLHAPASRNGEEINHK